MKAPGILCQAQTSKGQPCKAYCAPGIETCRLHSQNAADEIAARHQRAAEVRAEEAARLTLETPEQVKALIAETATRLRAGQIPAATAVALDRLARTALSAIEARQLEEATRELGH
jgi:hypothetical protein